MNISFKILLLLSISTTLQMTVIDFKELLYHEICDPEVIENPIIYEATEIFNHMYWKISEKQDLQLHQVQKNFNDHFELMQQYMTELTLIKKIMVEEQLSKTKEHFFREQLIFLRQKIGTLIGDLDVKEEMNQMQLQLQGSQDSFLPTTSINIPSQKDLQDLHNKNLLVYVNILDKKYKTPAELNSQELIEGPIDFAEREAEQSSDSRNIYFKKEICDVEEMLGKAIYYMVEGSTNNQSNAQNMLSLNREMLDTFIESLISWDFDQKFGCNATVWNYLLKQLTPVKGDFPEAQIQPEKIKNFKPVLENMKNHEKDALKEDILKRDYYMLFFPILKEDWNQEDLNDIPNEVFKIPLSPIFANYLLGTAPAIMKTWEFFIRRRDLDDNPYQNDPLDDSEIEDNIKDLYDLYTIIRITQELPETTDTDQKDIDEILIAMLNKLMNYQQQPEDQDEPMEDLFEPANRIKLILVIKQLLGWKDQPLDQQKQPTFEDLNQLMQKLHKGGIPEDEKPIEYLLNNYQVPKDIWDKFNKDKAEEEVKTIFKQMRTLKKKVKSIPPTMAVRDFNPENSEDEEEPVSKNVKEIKMDIAAKLKTILFTLTWMEKLNANQSPDYENDIVSNIMDIIDNTESRTQLALFVKSLKDIINKPSIPFDQTEFKKDINMRSKQTIELDPEMINKNKNKIRIMISQKLQQKLENNLHYSDGLLKVWNWAGFFDEKFTLSFNSERGLFNDLEEIKKSKDPKKAQQAKELYLRRGMAFDICFLEEAITKYQNKNKGNHIQKYRNLVYDKKYKAKIEKTYNCENIKELLFSKTNPKIIDNFSVILMGIRFSDVYQVLDNFEIDVEENEQVVEDQDSLIGKSLSISKYKKKYLGKVFHDIYISQLHYRLNNWKDDYHNPIETFNNEVKMCVEMTFKRTHSDDYMSSCPLDNINYHEQYTLLSYQRANETQIYKNGQDGDEMKDKYQELLNHLSLNAGGARNPKHILYYNTILLHILLRHSNESALNGNQLCHHDKDNQLCQEHMQIDLIVANDGIVLDLLIDNGKEQSKKLKFYNVLLFIETLYPTYFKKIMEENINHERSAFSKQIEEFLNIQENDQSWFPGWLKVNFSDMDPHLQNMRTAVMESFTKTHEETGKPGFQQILSFTNHSAYNTNDTTHVLNLKRVLTYLLLSTDMDNYQLISNYLSDRAWMVLMVYTEKEHNQSKLLRVEKEIDATEGGNFYEKMLEYFKEEDEELIESIEDSMFDNDDSMFGDEFQQQRKNDHEGNTQGSKSQQINGQKVVTHQFQNFSSDEEEEFDEMNKKVVENQMGIDLMQMLEKFNIEVEDPQDFEEVQEQITQACEMYNCQDKVMQIMEAYKANVGSSSHNVVINSNFLI